jgi:hypothetical protein
VAGPSGQRKYPERSLVPGGSMSVAERGSTGIHAKRRFARMRRPAHPGRQASTLCGSLFDDTPTMELNPLFSALDDLKARVDALRGYL